MLAIVRIVNNEPAGWIIAEDLAEATRMAYAAGDQQVADMLYRMPPDFMTGKGKHELRPGEWLLRY